MADFAHAPATYDVDQARRCFNRNMQTFGMVGAAAGHAVACLSRRHFN
jgi:hypothetical protein